MQRFTDEAANITICKSSPNLTDWKHEDRTTIFKMTKALSNLQVGIHPMATSWGETPNAKTRHWCRQAQVGCSVLEICLRFWIKQGLCMDPLESLWGKFKHQLFIRVPAWVLWPIRVNTTKHHLHTLPKWQTSSRCQIDCSILGCAVCLVCCGV